MDTKIYQPPQAEVIVKNNKPGSVVKAVVVGAIIEIVGTVFVGTLVGLIYGVILVAQGSAAEEIQSAMGQIEPWSLYGLMAFFTGGLVSIFAGYICARIANVSTYKAAYLLSAISVTFGTIAGYDAYSWWVLLLLNLVTIAAVLFGARLYIGKLKATAKRYPD